MGSFVRFTFLMTLSFGVLSVSNASLEYSQQNGGPSPSTPRQQEKQQNSIENPPYRLPKTILPINYELRLQPILKPDLTYDRYTIPGYVRINIQCVEATNVITLHAKDISFNQITVRDSNNRNIPTNGSNYGNYDFYHIHMETPLQENATYAVNIDFTSKMSRSDLFGMYVSTYTDIQNGIPETKEMASTTLFPTNARRLFPCFDEPHFKTQFGLMCVSQRPLQCLTNSQVYVSLTTGPYLVQFYRPTPKMPTYLVSYIVSELPFAQMPSNSSLRVRTYAPSQYITDDDDGADWSLNITHAIVSDFETLTNESFGFTKLDHVAVPEFAFGAMENWGLISYRLERLMHIPGENSELDRQRVAQIVAHELAHQWFGNVITYDWWSEAWLSEGFASFLEHRGLGVAAPEFNSETSIVHDSIQPAMKFDQGNKSHPVYRAELKPEDVMGFFDTIAYDKGAALLRMLESVLTEEVLNAGMQRFLKDNAGGTVVTDDFWNAVQEVAGDKLPEGLSIAEFMRPWVTLPGYPMLRVSVLNNSHVYVSQEKFTPNTGGASTTHPNDGSFWNIPIKVVKASEHNVNDRTPTFWMFSNTTLQSYAINTDEWFIFNADAAGYFRVLYEQQILTKIKDQLTLDHTIFTPATRSQLIDDYLQFAFERYIRIETALEVTSYVGNETELVAWKPLIDFATDLTKKFALDSNELKIIQDYFLPKITSAQNHEDLQGENGKHLILRSMLFDLAVLLNGTSQKAYARDLFDSWMETFNGSIPTNWTLIPADIRSSVLCSGMEVADQETWNRVAASHAHAKYSGTKSLILRSLSCSANRTILEGYIELAESFGNNLGICLEDALKAIAENSAERALAYEYAKGQVLQEPSEKSGKVFAHVLSVLRNYYYTTDLTEEVQIILDLHGGSFPSSIESLRTSLQTMRENQAWRSSLGSRIVSWFVTKNQH